MRIFRAAPLILFAAAVLSVTACDNSSMTGAKTGPNSPNVFADQIGLGGFTTILSSGTSRVSIRVIPGTMTASRVRVRQGDQVNRPERIVSEVASLDTTGTIVLSLGGISVSFDATTKFEGWHDAMDSDDSAAMGEAGFISRLQTALAAGHHPTIVAIRAAPATPQAPTDGSFHADVLRLNDDADRPTIEMNVTSANLANDTAPPPDAFLTVLNVAFGLDVTGHKTRIDANTHNTMGAIPFEGRVKSVDTTGGTATLADSAGTVIKVPTGGEIERPDDHDEDFDNPLSSLSRVAAALAAGDTVDAAGFGLSAGADTIDAIEIRFRVRDNHEFEPMVVGFEGNVTSADTMSGKVVLGNGTTIDLTDSTHFITMDGGLANLGAVVQALGDTAVRVRAEGAGKPVSTTEITAFFIRFEADSGGEHH